MSPVAVKLDCRLMKVNSGVSLGSITGYNLSMGHSALKKFWLVVLIVLVGIVFVTQLWVFRVDMPHGSIVLA